MKRGISVIVIVILLSIPFPRIQAQETDPLTADQRDALTFVLGAFDNLRALDSYAAAGSEEQNQITRVEDHYQFTTTSARTIETRMAFDTDRDLLAAQGILSVNQMLQMNQGEIVSTDISASFSIMDDVLYQRFEFDRYDPQYLMLDSNIETFFQPQWYALPAADLLNIHALEVGTGAYVLQSLVMPAVTPTRAGEFWVYGMIILLTEDMVLNIVELPSESISGETMRVFELTLDPAPVRLEEMRVSALGPVDPTDEIDAETYQELVELMRERFQMQMIIQISTDSHLPYQIDATFTGTYDSNELETLFSVPETSDSGGDQNIITRYESHSITTFSLFNMPFEVTAPPDATPFLSWFTEEE